MEDSLSKMDREFQDSNIRTEEARLGWETAMYRYCQVSAHRTSPTLTCVCLYADTGVTGK